MMNNYSREIVQAIREHLDNRDMKRVAFDEKEGTFSFIMHLPGQISFIHYLIRVHDDDYTVIAIVPVCPDPDDKKTISALGELVCRANYGLKNGCFEIDYRDGEIRYKAFVDCDGQLPCEGIIRDSIGVPAAMVKRYGPGILNVLFKGMDPEEAVDECEEDREVRRGLQDELRRSLDRALGRLRDREDSDDEEEGDDDSESPEMPSFEEFLRMMSSSEDDEDEEETPASDTPEDAPAPAEDAPASEDDSEDRATA